MPYGKNDKRSRRKRHPVGVSRLSQVFCLALTILAGCKMLEVEHHPVSIDGIPLGGSDVCCPPEENRGIARPVGNLKLSQYGPVVICQDEWADKVVPWLTVPDCSGREKVLERLIGRRRLGHTIPLMGWLGVGRLSEPGRYCLARTWQQERDILATANLCFTIKKSMTIDGVRFSDDDVIAFDGRRVAKLIDGGDIGTSKLEIDAFAVLSEDRYLISYASDFEVDSEHLLPGLSGMVRDEDVLLFEASSLGEMTRGVFSVYIDGSDVGLENTDIDALAVLDNGDVICSLDRRTKIGSLDAGPSDLLKLELHQIGPDTRATWSVLINARDAGIDMHNIDAIDCGIGDEWLVSTEESLVHLGEVYDQADVFPLANLSPKAISTGAKVIPHDHSLSRKGTTLEGNDISAFAVIHREYSHSLQVAGAQ